MRLHSFIAVASLCSAAVTAQETPATAPRAATAPSLVMPGEKAAAAAIRADRLRGRIRFLSHDLLEGRAPATRGDKLAEAYIASEMEASGLEPGAPGGGWFQPFDIVRIESHCPPTISFLRADKKLDLRFGDDFIAVSGVQTPETRLDAAEIVFVGYGIVAPEFQWDDYKGTDLKGKVLLMMNNDPETDESLFAGKTRLYYGRWDYKYEIAEKVGAAGAIIIHTEPSAGYKWQVIQSGWIGERFDVPSSAGLPVEAWATEDASKRIAQLGGQDLDALRAAAQKRDFRPVPLGVSLSLALKNDTSRQQTANVIGRLPGRDPLLSKQAVVYTAHHDHLGMRAGAGDTIYNGALDNATGVSGILAIADAFRSLRQPPRRAVYFAAVAGEEQGLLGSKYLAEHPPLAPGRIAANVNVDGLGIWGRTTDLTMIGLGKSNLDDFVKALLAWQGRHVVPDQFPDKGFFYRSDQFSLAKIGVPAAYFDAGTEVVGKPPGWGKQAQQDYEDKHYHQPSDELRDDWNFDGAVEDAQFLFYLGLKVANSQRMPVWKPGDEFEAARKKALSDVKN